MAPAQIRSSIAALARDARKDEQAPARLWQIFNDHLPQPGDSKGAALEAKQAPIWWLALEALSEGLDLEPPPAPSVLQFYEVQLSAAVYTLLAEVAFERANSSLEAPLCRLLALIAAGEEQGKVKEFIFSDLLKSDRPVIATIGAKLAGELAIVVEEFLLQWTEAKGRDKGTSKLDACLAALYASIPLLNGLMSAKNPPLRLAAAAALGNYQLARRRDAELPRIFRKFETAVVKSIGKRTTPKRERIAFLQALSVAPSLSDSLASTLEAVFEESKDDPELHLAVIAAIGACGEQAEGFSGLLRSALADEKGVAAAAQEALKKISRRSGME